MSMSFETRLRAALGILAKTDIRPIWYAPPVHRLLWRMSVRIRPPHFSGVPANLYWLCPMFLAPLFTVQLIASDDTLLWSLGDSALTALCFACAGGSSYKRSAELNLLPAWDEVESPDQRFRPPPSKTTNWLRGA
jgi:hypothetical protein